MVSSIYYARQHPLRTQQKCSMLSLATTFAQDRTPQQINATKIKWTYQLQIICLTVLAKCPAAQCGTRELICNPIFNCYKHTTLIVSMNVSSSGGTERKNVANQNQQVLTTVAKPN